MPREDSGSPPCCSASGFAFSVIPTGPSLWRAETVSLHPQGLAQGRAHGQSLRDGAEGRAHRVRGHGARFFSFSTRYLLEFLMTENLPPQVLTAPDPFHPDHPLWSSVCVA